MFKKKIMVSCQEEVYMAVCPLVKQHQQCQ